MSGRALVRFGWLVIGVLAAVGLYLNLFYVPESVAPERHEARRTIEGAVGGAALTRTRRPEPKRRSAPPSTRDERERRTAFPRRLQRQAGRARVVVRRFFAYFARYELGGVNQEIAAGLRATATTSFAAQLLRAPPRLDPRSPTGGPARLARLAFVPGRLDGDGDLAAAELVGTVRRGDASAPFAIELVRSSRGWRVSGLGR